ncbi:CD209 antigen-like protein C isoform X3 [Strix aluco]|uniref:CD209 antigen-like protein C isoform X3 n=1 Tax=Strix aluco TaxID=111821 RepID=UPI003DA2C520
MWFWSLVQALFSTPTAAAKTPRGHPRQHLAPSPPRPSGLATAARCCGSNPSSFLGGNNPIPSQDMEVLSSGCSWESCWTNSNQRATPEFKCSLSCFRLQLRQRLCEEQHQHPTGPSACRLCPAGWQPFAAKCYWISTKTESWEKAAKDCLDQRSQLVKLESVEEKVFIGNMTKNISAAWLGLSITRARGREWTWWDGSPLQGTLFKTPDHGEGDACATIRRGELNPHSCTTPLHWICQKEATEV